jgi:hypothetical protein
MPNGQYRVPLSPTSASRGDATKRMRPAGTRSWQNGRPPIRFMTCGQIREWARPVPTFT